MDRNEAALAGLWSLRLGIWERLGTSSFQSMQGGAAGLTSSNVAWRFQALGGDQACGRCNSIEA